MPREQGGPAAGTPKKKNLSSIISFATKLGEALPLCADLKAAETWQAEVQDQFKFVQGFAQNNRAKTQKNGELDKAGTDVWNVCVRLRRDLPPDGQRSEAQKGKAKLLTLVRVLAFYLLDLVHLSDKVQDIIRLTKQALKAARCCLDEKEVNLALLCLQKAAAYTDQMRATLQDCPADDVDECRRLEAEYLTLRIALAVKQSPSRLDVAEHMYPKFERLKGSLDAASAEAIADLFFEIGKRAASNKDYPMAVKWLDRAADIMNSQDLDRLSQDATQLRLAISQVLVKALLGLDTQNGYEKAENLVGCIEAELGDIPLVLLLRLDTIFKAPAEVFDCDSYANVIRRMIRGFAQTEDSFRLILHHIRQLHQKSPGLGSTALDDFLVSSIAKYERPDWVERLVLTRIWMASMGRDAAELVGEVSKMINGLQGKLDKPLSPEAAVSALSLMLPKIDHSYNEGHLDLAEGWCRLALKEMFASCGPQNTAKLERKLLLCALARNDIESATGVFNSMSEYTRKEPLTSYLAYKMAVRNQDRELASDCLQHISQQPDDQGCNLLCACVLDAQHADDKLFGVKALKSLTGRHEHLASTSVHLPALFRCTIRLVHSLLDDCQSDEEENQVLQDLCTLFQEVIAAIRNDPRDADGKKLYDTAELEWFSKQAYNLGLRHISAVDPTFAVKFLQACLRINDVFPADVGSDFAGDLAMKNIFSNFIISAAFVALARAEDNIEERLQCYLSARRHIAAFDQDMQTHLDSFDDNLTRDMIDKLAALLVFDFEAAVELKKWDELGETVRKATKCEDAFTYQAMIACLLSADVPSEKLYTTMRLLINEVWTLERFSNQQLAKHIRCLFQAIGPHDARALQLMDESCSIAAEAIENAAPWPAEELEWIATTAFNHAIDCYGVHDDEGCRNWAERALVLASKSADDGALAKVLQDRYILLSFEA